MKALYLENDEAQTNDEAASDPPSGVEEFVVAPPLDVSEFPNAGQSLPGVAFLLGRRPSVSVFTMDTILRELGLSRNELVWLNTYVAGRLQALPPASVQHAGSHTLRLTWRYQSTWVHRCYIGTAT